MVCGLCGKPSQDVLCVSCSREQFRLRPSTRTQTRFVWGLVATCSALLLFPFALLPGLVAAVFASSRYALQARSKLLIGTGMFFLLWIAVIPQLSQARIGAGIGLVLGLWLALLVFYLWSPGRTAAGELLFRGRGLLAGFISGVSLLAVLFSVLGVLLAFFF